MVINIHESMRDEIIANLVELHKKTCEKGEIKEAIRLTRYIQRRLKKGNEKIIYNLPEENSQGSENPPKKLGQFYGKRSRIGAKV